MSDQVPRAVCRCEYHQTGIWPRGGPVNLWTPERVTDHLRRGWILPANWRAILAAEKSQPVGQMTLDEGVA